MDFTKIEIKEKYLPFKEIASILGVSILTIKRMTAKNNFKKERQKFTTEKGWVYTKYIVNTEDVVNYINKLNEN